MLYKALSDTSDTVRMLYDVSINPRTTTTRQQTNRRTSDTRIQPHFQNASTVLKLIPTVVHLDSYQQFNLHPLDIPLQASSMSLPSQSQPFHARLLNQRVSCKSNTVRHGTVAVRRCHALVRRSPVRVELQEQPQHRLQRRQLLPNLQHQPHASVQIPCLRRRR